MTHYTAITGTNVDGTDRNVFTCTNSAWLPLCRISAKFKTIQHTLVNRPPSKTDVKCSTYWKMWYILENLVHTGKFSKHWKMQYTLENVVHTGKCSTYRKMQYILENVVHTGKFSNTGKCGTYWKIQYTLENLAHTGKFSTHWKMQYTLENVVHAGKFSTCWNIQYTLENLVHIGKFGAYWKMQYILENVHTGKFSTRWKMQYILENVVHTGKRSFTPSRKVRNFLKLFSQNFQPLKHIPWGSPAPNFSQNFRQIWRGREEIHFLPSVKCDCNTQFS